MKTILVIEDNGNVLENIEELLRLAQYNVIRAENGKKGVVSAMSTKPDLIICDISMPELDGYEVLHILSRNPETNHIPFIFLTAKSEKEDFRRGMELGADDYIVKPFENKELLKAVEVRLKKTEFLKFAQAKDNETSGKESPLNELLHDNKRKLLLKRKHQVYKENTFPHFLYYIVSGCVKTFRSNKFGRELITGIYKKDEFFGYLALLENRIYHDSAICMEDSELVIISRKDFFTMLYAEPKISGEFIKMLANNLEEKEDRLLKLAYNSVRKRMAEALLFIYERQKKDPRPEIIKLTREEIASLIGATTETVIRTCADFREEGLIQLEGKFVVIKDLTGLENMKN